MFVPRVVRYRSSSKKLEESQETQDPATTEDKTNISPQTVSRNVPSSSRGSDEESLVEDDEPVVSYSKLQRWPEEGEPVCVICGRYGAYIVDRTDQDVCSLECKAKHLHKLRLPLVSEPASSCEPSKTSENTSAGADVAGGSWEYKEAPDVVAMSTAEVEQLRARMRIKVEGRHPPRPVTELRHLNLPNQLRTNLEATGYHTLTPVQMQVIPATLYQRDLLACSSTGSGKTLAFLLPIILNLLCDSKRGVAMGGASEGSSGSVARAPAAVVLVPTRELAVQIEDLCKQLMKGLPQMKTALVVGGVPLATQLYRLRSGVEVVVATPARLQDILYQHGHEVDFSRVEQFVIDEVDCLLHMGFKEQVKGILEELPASRQTLMFSATVPGWVSSLARRMMKDPVTVVVGESGVLCESVRHTVLWVEEKSKKKKLLEFLRDKFHFRPPAVIFVGSKKGTLLLADSINKGCIVHATAVGLHGDMAQQRRTEIVREFLDGRHSVIVATNVLARGVDLQNVHQVFVFDLPSSLLEFIHQVGRAGRLGAPGCAVTFINNSNKSLFLGLHGMLARLGVAIPPELLTSPYLALQLEERKRKMADSGGEESSKTPGSKRRKTDRNLAGMLEVASSLQRK